MRERIEHVLKEIDTKNKITKIVKSKVRNENAYWLYRGTGSLGLFISEDDLRQNNEWLAEYLKCVLDYDFNYEIMQKESLTMAYRN